MRTCKKELGDSKYTAAQEHRSLYVNEVFVAYFKAPRDWARRARGYLSGFSSQRETVSYIQMFTSTTNSSTIFLLLYNSSSLTFLTHIVKESEKSLAEKASCETASALSFTAKLIHIFNPFLPHRQTTTFSLFYSYKNILSVAYWYLANFAKELDKGTLRDSD